MKTRRTTFAVLVIAALLGSSAAEANRRSRRRRSNRNQRTHVSLNNSGGTARFAALHRAAEQKLPQVTNEHGRRSFQTALNFAKEHDLPVATVVKSGQPRLLVNVPKAKVKAWTKAFSAEACFIEPFFRGKTKTTKPGWSYMRDGDRHYQQYGSGSKYTASSGSRTAFPVSLSSEEHRRVMHEINTRQNAGFEYNGGNPVRTPTNSSGRNCTNWVTYVIHPFTGVRTNAVVSHGSQLFDRNVSGRVTVMAVMTNALIEDFSAEEGKNRNWH